MSRLSGWDLNANVSVLIRGRQRGGGSVTTETDCSNANSHQKLEEAKNGFFPTASKGSTAPVTLTLNFWRWRFERINGSGFKPLSLW